jgi:hypothetical protein
MLSLKSGEDSSTDRSKLSSITRPWHKSKKAFFRVTKLKLDGNLKLTVTVPRSHGANNSKLGLSPQKMSQ